MRPTVPRRVHADMSTRKLRHERPYPGRMRVPARSSSSTSPGSRTTPRVRRRRRRAAPQRVPHDRPRGRLRPRRADRQVARRRLHGRRRRADRRHRLHARPRGPRGRGVRAAHAAGRHRHRATRCCSRATTTSARPSTWPPACATSPTRYEVLIPTMGLERLPEGVIADAARRVELRRLPRPDRGVRAHRRPRARPTATTPASSGPARRSSEPFVLRVGRSADLTD